MLHTNDELVTALLSLQEETGWQQAFRELVSEVPTHDLAVALTEISEEKALPLLNLLDAEAAAETLQYMEFYEQYRFVDHMDKEAARRLLAEMPSDALVDLVGAVHPRQAQQLMAMLAPEQKTLIQELLTYPPNTAGGLMTEAYVAVHQKMTMAEVLRHVRKVGDDAETIAYVYVVDGSGRLVGVLSLRDLVLAAPESKVADYMTTAVVTVLATLDQEEVAHLVAEYNFVAIPVVSQDNKLLGIITVDDVIDVIEEEATEDAYRFAATSAPEPAVGQPWPSVWALARPRLPWLLSLLFLELGSGYIVNVFSGIVTPGMAVLLALFTVVMAGESGNAATQALAVTVRGLATGDIETEDLLRVVWREARVGLVVGLLTGLTLAVVAYLWQRNLWFSIVIGLALVTNLFIAKILGGLFPVVMERLGVDPAVASGPFITTLTDNTSVLIYYALAALLLGLQAAAL